MESILTSIKKMLGIEESYTHFDEDITMYINMAFSTLSQLGVGPTEGYILSSYSSVWSDYLGNVKDFEMVKTYIYLSVRMVFDPPSSSFVLDSMARQKSELEWRISAYVENKNVEV